MQYLGLDVHTSTTSWCLLSSTGEHLRQGKIKTTQVELLELIAAFLEEDDLTAAQESGTLSTFIFDVFSPTKAVLLTFNASHIRMIAASRKKSDRRDAYWLAKTTQSGMMPHPVYIPTGIERTLRVLLSERDSLVGERKRWYLRAHRILRAEGKQPKKAKTVKALLLKNQIQDDTIQATAWRTLERCDRMEQMLLKEIHTMDTELKAHAAALDDVQRLQTIPGVGLIVSLLIYAWVGDVNRFPNARKLTAYAGLVPSVRQSGGVAIHGQLTKQGSTQLRTGLIQSAQVILNCCRSEEAKALQCLGLRVKQSSGKTKIAIAALARHVLRISFYILRDHGTYDPALISAYQKENVAA